MIIELSDGKDPALESPSLPLLPASLLKLVYMHRMSTLEERSRMEWLTSDYFRVLHLGPQSIKAKANHLSVTFFKGTTKIPVGRTLTTPIVTSSLSRF